jgi:hypothetical protein
MKLNDIINEENISEVPVDVGTALKTGLKAMNPFSTSGRAQAQGAIISNKKANEIYAAYYKWVGQHNSPTTAKSAVDFLKQSRYSPAAIKAANDTMKGSGPAGAALDKNVISKAFLAAAQKAGTAAPAPRRVGTAPTGSPSPSPAPSPSPSPSPSPAPSPAPAAIDIKDIYNHYKSMSPEQRQTFRQNLDLIDSEPETPEPMNIDEGYSRFLGIQL